jgi:hypothetical protein
MILEKKGHPLVEQYLVVIIIRDGFQKLQFLQRGGSLKGVSYMCLTQFGDFGELIDRSVHVDLLRARIVADLFSPLD